MQKFTHLFDRLSVESLRPRYPSVAVEITADRVAAVRLAVDRKGGRMRLAAAQGRPPPEGAVDVSPTNPDILDQSAAMQALPAFFVQVAPPGHPVALLLPDDVS